MSDHINPALTPEEWNGEEAVVLSTTSPKLGHFVRVEAASDGLTLGVHGPHEFTLDTEDRHALAAFALYGQSFGPTWDMVDVLREVSQYRMLTPRESKGLAIVIAFVQALLPPRVDDVSQAEE